MVQGKAASYVFAERLKIQQTEPRGAIAFPPGNEVIVLYLELDHRIPAAERKMFTIDQARQLHHDLGKLLAPSNDGFLPASDWTPED